MFQFSLIVWGSVRRYPSSFLEPYAWLRAFLVTKAAYIFLTNHRLHRLHALLLGTGCPLQHLLLHTFQVPYTVALRDCFILDCVYPQ